MTARHGATDHLLLSGQQVTADRHRTRRWTTGACGGITVEQCVAPRVRSAGARELWQLRGTHLAAQMRRQHITRTELGSNANPVIQTPCKLRPPPTLVRGWNGRRRRHPPAAAETALPPAWPVAVLNWCLLTHSLTRSLTGLSSWRGGGGDVAARMEWTAPAAGQATWGAAAAAAPCMRRPSLVRTAP
eukprot:COSAG01_NODE_3210_length_6414_cov_54.271417_3_plen_188_part_00